MGSHIKEVRNFVTFDYHVSERKFSLFGCFLFEYYIIIGGSFYCFSNVISFQIQLTFTNLALL